MVCCNLGLEGLDEVRLFTAAAQLPSSSEDRASVDDSAPVMPAIVVVVGIAALAPPGCATLRSVTGPRFRHAATYRSSVTPGIKSECGRGCGVEAASGPPAPPLREGGRRSTVAEDNAPSKLRRLFIPKAVVRVDEGRRPGRRTRVSSLSFICSRARCSGWKDLGGGG